MCAMTSLCRRLLAPLQWCLLCGGSSGPCWTETVPCPPWMRQAASTPRRALYSREWDLKECQLYFLSTSLPLWYGFVSQPVMKFGNLMIPIMHVLFCAVLIEPLPKSSCFFVILLKLYKNVFSITQYWTGNWQDFLLDHYDMMWFLQCNGP